MSGKQNFIFFLGMSLILLNFYFHGGFKVISTAIFGPGGISNPNPPTVSAGTFNSSSNGGFSNGIAGLLGPLGSLFGNLIPGNGAAQVGQKIKSVTGL